MLYSSGMPAFIDWELSGGYERWWIPSLLPSDLSASLGGDAVGCLGRSATLGYLCNQCLPRSKVMSVLTSKASVCAIGRLG